MNSARAQIAICCLLCFLAVAGIQHWSGATSAAFDGYPDEPSHYLGGLMVRDYLTAGLPMAPRTYAVNYYLHLPFIAIGYWPPLFYVTEGLWMKAVGYSRSEVLLFVALIAAVLAATIFAVVRPFLGVTGAFFSALLFLLMPDVLLGTSMVMTDTAVALLSFWSVLALARFFDSGRYQDSILFGFLASCTMMTKYSGAYLALVPVLGVLIGRRWDLLRRPSFWLIPVTVAVLCAPWALYTRQYATAGIASFVKSGFGTTVLQYLRLLTLESGVWLSILLLGGWICAGIYQAVSPAKANALILLLWVQPLSVLIFQSMAPVGTETRYLIPALPPLIVLLGFGLTRLPRWSGAAVLAATVAGCAVLWLPGFHRPTNQIRGVVEAITGKDSGVNQALVYVPSDGEGQTIAEFAMRDARRPMRILARTNKLIAKMDWLGNDYTSYYQRPADIEQFFVENPPDLLIVHPGVTGPRQFPHEGLLEATIQEYASSWKLLESVNGYDVYQFAGAGGARGVITPLFRSRMTGRFDER